MISTGRPPPPAYTALTALLNEYLYKAYHLVLASSPRNISPRIKMNCLDELDITCSIRLNQVDSMASRYISYLTSDMIPRVIDRRWATVSSLDNKQARFMRENSSC